MIESGRFIAHFKVIRKLGEGGMGRVYLAEDTKLGRKVALKILPDEYTDNREWLERFRREARTAARINHPSVMAIHDLGEAVEEDTGNPLNYIVMEYIDGRSLVEYLKQEESDLTGQLKLAEKIASGLASAHKLGIVHRDIKSDNIMIDSSGNPKILDFGLAKPVTAALEDNYGDSESSDTISKELTGEGKIVGTVTFMSPEQARGGSVDNRSDIFSFGIMLYKMFCGEYPFKGDDRISTIARILEARHEPICQKNELIPAELERIIDKCLQKDPDDRYQDTRDLAVDLRSLRRQFESGVTETVSSISGVSDAGGKTKISLSVSSRIFIPVVSVIIIAGLIYLFGGRSQPTTPSLVARENALAIFGFENRTGEAELDWLQAGLPEILLTDLAQNTGTDIISRNRVLDCLDDKYKADGILPNHEACIEAARKLGAAAVLSGSFYKMGDKIRIDARLEDIETGKIILGEKVVGKEPFVLVDSLTSKIMTSLNIQGRAAADRQVAELTTSSPEAYKEYIMGMERFANNLYDDAISHFQKAVSIDSTFALAYMRMGMTYAFKGRFQQGMPYFMTAKRLEGRLPARDKSLMAIYVDIWQEGNFDDAYAKLKSFVKIYPEDKEGRTIYALLLYSFTRDADVALAQLDTVMLLDPKYHLALTGYNEIYSGEKQYDKAIEWAYRLKQHFSGSPEPYMMLLRYNFILSRTDEAIKVGLECLEKFPNHASTLKNLVRFYALKKDFDSAGRYADILYENYKDDPYNMIDYFVLLSNIDFWKGKFKSAMKNQQLALEQALKSGDSTRISAHYSSMADDFLELDMPDSALYYAKESYRWARLFQTLDYPLIMIAVDPENEARAREIFNKALTEFKAKVPADLWGIAEMLEKRFNAIATNDTAESIIALKSLIYDHNQRITVMIETLGRILVKFGNYEEGRSILLTLLDGEDRTTQGFYHVRSLYYIGLANEMLGNKPEAITYYRDFLNFWNKPEIELKEIIDARKSLDRLTG